MSGTIRMYEKQKCKYYDKKYLQLIKFYFQNILTRLEILWKLSIILSTKKIVLVGYRLQIQ